MLDVGAGTGPTREFEGSNHMTAVMDGWQAEAVDLAKQGLDAYAIAEAVSKSPPTIRKALAKARDAGLLPPRDTGALSEDEIERLSRAADLGEVPPEDDPEYQAEDDPLDTFRQEAGEAVGAMPPTDPPESFDEPELREIVLTGTTQLGLFDAGGRSPDSASVRLAGGKIALVDDTAFEKGRVIHFSGTAVITAVKQQDKRDAKTGLVAGCEQQHTALITDLTVATGE